MDNQPKNEIVVRAEDYSANIRSYQWPVLEKGNHSFPQGIYRARWNKQNNEYTLTHILENAKLLERLVSENKARYAVAISSPAAHYRDIQFSESPEQKILPDIENFGGAPLFAPMVICAESFEAKLNSERDNVHQSLDKQTFRFEKGYRLAICDVFSCKPPLQSLLVFKPDSKLEDGRFRVHTSVEGNFQIIVFLSKKLYQFLAVSKGSEYPHIMTHIVSSAFALLQREHDEEQSLEHKNLERLADDFKERGLLPWYAPDFQPEFAATTYYPHRITQQDEEEDEI